MFYTSHRDSTEDEMGAVMEKASTFGRWLLDQRGRGGGIGELAKQAAGDPAFPKNGSVQDVQKRLNSIGADGDTWQALEDAELDWLAI